MKYETALLQEFLDHLDRRGIALAWTANPGTDGTHELVPISSDSTRHAIFDFFQRRTIPDRPTTVCLCGSTRFSDAFHEANLRETLAGNIVLSIGCDFKSDTDLLLAGELTQEDKERLDELHLRKIDLADEVLFLNVNGYMGESTRREHQYAVNHGKVLRYLVEPD